MARTSVLAAGGIVLRQAEPPRIAVVRLRKRNEWVLPKGKLDEGETPRAAAEREVLEETGHEVTVHEFVGTLVYDSGGRSKIVHYWRMQANGEPAHELMHDVREVDWLPLDEAVARLSRFYEQTFLANVGPHALEAAALDGPPRRKAKKPALRKRRSKPPVPVEYADVLLEAPRLEPASLPPPPPSLALAANEPPAPGDFVLTEAPCELAASAMTAEVVVPASVPVPMTMTTDIADMAVDEAAGEGPVAADSGDVAGAVEDRPRGFAELLRVWLRRATRKPFVGA